MTDADEPAAVDEPRNPFTRALIWISVLGMLIGLTVVGIAAGHAATFSPNSDQPQPDDGIAELIWGLSFIAVAVGAFLIWVGVRAVLWRAPVVAPPSEATLQAAPGTVGGAG